jgi:hypothetical protein
MNCDSDLEEQKVASQLLYHEYSARAAGKPVGLQEFPNIHRNLEDDVECTLNLHYQM